MEHLLQVHRREARCYDAVEALFCMLVALVALGAGKLLFWLL